MLLVMSNRDSSMVYETEMHHPISVNYLTNAAVMMAAKRHEGHSSGNWLGAIFINALSRCLPLFDSPIHAAKNYFSTSPASVVNSKNVQDASRQLGSQRQAC